MTAERVSQFDRRVEAAIAELQGLIQERYPSATFSVDSGEDPGSVWLTATVDVEDTDEVFDVVVDRVLEIQIEEGLPIHVIPVRTPERIAAMLRERRRQATAASAPSG